ncbi:putative carbonyl reductase 1 [Besnoitia besnoiti]|uniref:Putative carbonyl reductase 1 n=1 Tax=Besnoitia besnoiti TaxID=94643 RepID=A0A2A9M6U0_BESBE|nr:putative carbonyl reductase 1 [Besnoitia besnoiti]PFH32021.1 putative carbonyl reductase 1 [Besnoitia besnoiti]
MEKKRVALVTGGNKGIGLFVVKRLCERLPTDKWVVVLGTRQVANGEEGVAQLKRYSLPLSPTVQQLDITDKASCEKMKTFLQEKFGGLDLLVNNAGFAFKRDATESKYEQAKKTIGVNYYGTKQVTDILLPLMRDGGRIVSVASMCGKWGLDRMTEQHRRQVLSPELTFEKLDSMMEAYITAAKTGSLSSQGWPESTYEMSKTAVIAATHLWALAADKNELGPNGAKGMFVACCCPGWCKTDMAGWEQPPLSADDGAERVADLALRGGANEQGQFLMEKRVVPLGFSQRFTSQPMPVQTWLAASA